MNFTLYFDDAKGFTAYMFNFVNGKMNWAMNAEGAKRTDAEDMEEYLIAAHDTGLPSHIAINN